MSGVTQTKHKYHTLCCPCRPNSNRCVGARNQFISMFRRKNLQDFLLIISMKPQFTEPPARVGNNPPFLANVKVNRDVWLIWWDLKLFCVFVQLDLPLLIFFQIHRGMNEICAGFFFNVDYIEVFHLNNHKRKELIELIKKNWVPRSVFYSSFCVCGGQMICDLIVNQLQLYLPCCQSIHRSYRM